MTNSRSIGSTVEIANVALTLREDLDFTLQLHGEKTCYLIEDEKSSRFFRIGIPEYTFISLLDGTTTVREAMAHTASLLGTEAFSEQDAATICKWLIESQLARTEASGSASRLLDSSQKSLRAKRSQWLNPIIVRLPLLRPDSLMTWVARRMGWWVSRPAFAVWLVTVVIAIQQLLTHWQQFSSSSTRILAPGNLLYLGIAWCLLKVAHEVSHGVACKKFGGHVREAGVVLIALAPIPYVDVTSAWRFPSKWQRIFVSAAGMYTELFLAAVATILWVRIEPGLMRQQAQNVMLTASLMTLLFNANPLMRFDGYYMLSDWLEIPNLYGLGQHYIHYLGRRYMMGIKAKLPTWSLRKSICIKIYGILALLWRFVVCASLLIAAATLFAGAGIVLAIMAGVLWIAYPTWKLCRYLVQGNNRERPKIGRFIATSSLLALSVGLVLMLPEPGGVRAPAVVSYEPLHVIRAPHAGFIREIHTTSGAQVKSHETLMVLENPELEVEAAGLRLERHQSLYRSRQFRNERDFAASQVEAEMRQAVERRLAERAEQLEQSVITAPAEGRVVVRDLASLLGTFVEEGEALLAIGNEHRKELEISIAQEDVETFVAHAGDPVDVYLRAAGCRPLSCRLGAVDPRASCELQDPSLGASNGGPLPVQPTSEDNQTGDESRAWELIEPRFLAKAALSAEQSDQLRAGQTTTVILRVARGTLGGYLYRNVSDWFEQRLRRAMQNS